MLKEHPWERKILAFNEPYMVRKAAKKIYRHLCRMSCDDMWRPLQFLSYLWIALKSHFPAFPKSPSHLPYPMLLQKGKGFLRQHSLPFVLDSRSESGNRLWKRAVSHISLEIKEKCSFIQNEIKIRLVISHYRPIHSTAVEIFSNVFSACETLWGSFKEQVGNPWNTQPLTWILWNLTGLTVVCWVSRSLLWLPPRVWYFCDLGHQETSWCVHSIKQGPGETLI